MPAATTYGSHFQLDTRLSSPVEYSWNSSYNGDYDDAEFGAGLTEEWSFDFCNWAAKQAHLAAGKKWGEFILIKYLINGTLIGLPA